MKKHLILLCDNYPLTAGEFFIDDEMKVLAPFFQRIVVVLKKQSEQNNLNRYIPENLEVITYTENINFKTKIFGFLNIFRIFFIKEWGRALKKYSLRYCFSIFKIMYMDVLRAKELLKYFKKTSDINNENTIYYSYWHDYKALTLCFLPLKTQKIARAHGWDVFADRHTPPYLPLKNYILENLTQTFSISESGKKYFYNYTDGKYNDKITVSRLGKFNHRQPLLSKINKHNIIISCSNIIPLKRLHLVIDLLYELDMEHLKWIHFGDGILREEIQKYAQEKLRTNAFEFKGIVSNPDILDFYAENYVDLFINVSESEGIPVSIMEAISAGIPVVATNVGGTSEIVNHENGFLIEKDFNIKDTAITIKNYLLSSEENKLNYRKNAYNFWKENYNAEKNYSIFVAKIFTI